MTCRRGGAVVQRHVATLQLARVDEGADGGDAAPRGEQKRGGTVSLRRGGTVSQATCRSLSPRVFRSFHVSLVHYTCRSFSPRVVRSVHVSIRMHMHVHVRGRGRGRGRVRGCVSMCSCFRHDS